MALQRCRFWQVLHPEQHCVDSKFQTYKAASSLKLSILGANITKHQIVDSVFGWELSDGNEAKFTLQQTEDSRVVKGSIVLPGMKDAGKEVCIHYGHEEAS